MASGAGTNFEAIVRSLEDSHHSVVCLISDQPQSRALERARAHTIRSEVVDYATGREGAESRIIELLEELQPALVALAGYMRILSPSVIDLLPGSIVNVHPSLLPSFPGTKAIERSYRAGAPMGVTIHRVDQGVDTGPVLAQRELSRDNLSSLEDAEARIHEIEHEVYPAIVRQLLDSFEAPGST